MKKSTTSKWLLVGGAGAATLVIGTFISKIKNMYGAPEYRPSEPVSMRHKTVIVTGATSGIGLQTSKELAYKGARVIMACRDLEKCKKARKDIVLASRNRQIVCRECDLSSYSSIRKFAANAVVNEQHVDVLINNAGVMPKERSVTEEGVEEQFGVNYIGHYLLTMLLMDKLVKSSKEKNSRILNITCVSFRNGKIDFEDLNSEREFDCWDAYMQSKLANALFTTELNKRLPSKNITVNSVNPGLCATEIMRHRRGRFKWVKWIIEYLAYDSAYLGSQSIQFAAIAPELEGVSGELIKDCAIAELDDVQSGLLTDPKLNLRLWLTSQKWSRLEEQMGLFHEDVKAAQLEKIEREKAKNAAACSHSLNDLAVASEKLTPVAGDHSRSPISGALH